MPTDSLNRTYVIFFCLSKIVTLIYFLFAFQTATESRLIEVEEQNKRIHSQLAEYEKQVVELVSFSNIFYSYKTDHS